MVPVAARALVGPDPPTLGAVEQLPEVDEHVRAIAASPERTWDALLAVLAGTFEAVPGPLAAAWGLAHPVRRGDWRHPGPGDTVVGFAATAVEPPRLLTLRGRHRFSHYEARFVLDPTGPDGVTLRARTSAVFPGPLGRLYRAAVIGSGGHVLAVRGLLDRVARRAEGHRTRP